MERRFRRLADGEIALQLPPDERHLLRELAHGIRTLLAEDPDDPAARRLFPPAYADPKLEDEYRALMRTQLTSGREQALGRVLATVDQHRLSADDADAWLRALNDSRLVLGTRLDVTEDFDWDSIEPDDPEAAELALYAYVSWLQEQLVEAAGQPMP